MPYTGFFQEASGLATQTALNLPSDFPRTLAGIHGLVIPDVSGAQAANITILSAVVSGGGASGGQVSGAQFTIDPSTQQIVSGFAVPSGGTVFLTVYTDGDLPVNP